MVVDRLVEKTSGYRHLICLLVLQLIEDGNESLLKANRRQSYMMGHVRLDRHALGYFR